MVGQFSVNIQQIFYRLLIFIARIIISLNNGTLFCEYFSHNEHGEICNLTVWINILQFAQLDVLQ